MIAEDIKELLGALLERTKKREVHWIDSKQYGLQTVEQEDYIVVLPNSSINLWRSSLFESSEKGIVCGTILNSEGIAVLNFNAKGNKQDEALLEELLAWAKRSALKADETLEEIKRALAGKEKIGVPNAKKGDDVPF